MRIQSAMSTESSRSMAKKCVVTSSDTFVTNLNTMVNYVIAYPELMVLIMRSSSVGLNTSCVGLYYLLFMIKMSHIIRLLTIQYVRHPPYFNISCTHIFGCNWFSKLLYLCVTPVWYLDLERLPRRQRFSFVKRELWRLSTKWSLL